MKAFADSSRWVAAQLVLIAIGVAVIIYEIPPLPLQDAKLGGGFLIVIGALHILFFRSTGRKFFKRTQSSPRAIASFWARGGEKGTQQLFLGVGLILLLAGSALIVLRSL